jgi:hypothetical protein
MRDVADLNMCGRGHSSGHMMLVAWLGRRLIGTEKRPTTGGGSTKGLYNRYMFMVSNGPLLKAVPSCQLQVNLG